MAYNTTTESEELYFQQSQYPVKHTESDYLLFLRWPDKKSLGNFAPDAHLLQKVLSPEMKSAYSIAGQIFGNHTRQQYTNLAHLKNLLAERAHIYQEHVRDIDRRHMQTQEKLSCVWINNFPDKARRQSNLENQLLQLEQQRRDEELAFWNDTVKLREGLFESAAAYKDAKHRYSIFFDAETQYDR